MWIVIALLVDIGIYCMAGPKLATEFLGGYLIELSLSVDNLFVFLSIFNSFSVQEQLRHRVLHYGILGAAVLRMIFVLCGAAVISRFEWVLYLFGAVLVVNGVKTILPAKKGEEGVSAVWGRKLVGKFMPVTDDFCGTCFFVRKAESATGKKKRRYATPLFVVLVVVELSDILFAVDSVPAVFSVTTNPWIVYTSNLLAVLGLRQMYFGLETIANRFVYVKYGISAVLIFTGVKLLMQSVSVVVPTSVSIVFIFVVLLGSMVASVLFTKKGSA